MSYLAAARRGLTAAYSGARFVRKVARRVVKFRKPLLRAYTKYVKPFARKIPYAKQFNRLGKPFARGVRRYKRYL